MLGYGPAAVKLSSGTTGNEVQTVEQDAAAYMNHLLEHWRLPLAGVEEKRFFETHKTSHEDMSCEAMLEHAVMHPVRHRFQLEELMETQLKGS